MAKDVRRKMWHSAKRRAKKKGLEFDIEVDDIIIPDVCPLLEIAITESPHKHSHEGSPSLDRRDSTRGYTKNNIWVISHKANSAKNSCTIDEFSLIFNNWRKQYEEEYELWSKQTKGTEESGC